MHNYSPSPGDIRAEVASVAEVRVIDVTPRGFGEKLIAAYLVASSDVGVLVETGPRSSTPQLLEALGKMGVEVRYVIVTHIHLDHAGAAGTIARRLGVPVIVHPRGYKHLLNPSKLWSASKAVLGPIADVYGEPEPVPEGLLIAAGDGSRLSLPGGSSLRVVHTPGHASHHMSILLEPEGILFTGDSAGVSIEVDGRRVRLPTTPPPVKIDMYVESIRLMASLRPRRIAPTHYDLDPMDGVEYLEAHLSQFQRWVEEVLNLYRSGVRSIDEMARLLADRLPEARAAVESGNRIIYETFYKSTIMGLLDYAEKKLGGR